MKTNPMFLRSAYVALFSSMLASTMPALAGVAVVVSSKSPATAITVEQTSQLFLGKSATLPGGAQAVLIDQIEGANVRDEFFTKVTGRSSAQVKALWARLVFSGAAAPLKAVASDADVKKALAEYPGAIGYIDSASVDSSVKVLLKVD